MFRLNYIRSAVDLDDMVPYTNPSSLHLVQVLWLMFVLVWGTIKVAGARNFMIKDYQSVVEEKNQWTFGQVMSVLLLASPVFSMCCKFALCPSDTERQPGYYVESMSNIDHEDHQDYALLDRSYDSGLNGEPVPSNEAKVIAVAKRNTT